MLCNFPMPPEMSICQGTTALLCCGCMKSTRCTCGLREYAMKYRVARKIASEQARAEASKLYAESEKLKEERQLAEYVNERIRRIISGEKMATLKYACDKCGAYLCGHHVLVGESQCGYRTEECRKCFLSRSCEKKTKCIKCNVEFWCCECLKVHRETCL